MSGSRTRSLVVGLVVLTLCVGAGVLVGYWGEIGAGAVIATVLLVLAMVRPKEASLFVVGFGVVQYLFTKSFAVLPLAITVVDDVILAGVLVRSIADVISGSRRLGSPVVLFAALIWVGSGVLNGVLRGVSPSLMVLALRGIVLPSALLLAFGLYLEAPRDRESFRKLVVGLCSFHAALSIAQWIGSPSRVDIGFGVLGPGGANAAGFLDLLGLVLLLARPLSTRTWPLAVLLVVAPITSSARAAIYIMPLALLIVLVSRGSLSKGITRGMSAIAAAGLALWTYLLVVGRGLEELAATSLLRSQYNAGQGGRLLYVLALPQVLRGDPILWLFGLGPGQFTSYVGVGTLVPAFRLVAYTREGDTGFAYPDIEWAALLGEYGVVGTVAVVTMLIAPLLEWIRKRAQSVALRDVTIALPSVLAICLLAMVSLNVLEVQPIAYVLWAVLGLAYSLRTPAAEGTAEVEAVRG